MQTSVARWGNSLALRLPSKLAQQTNLVEGAMVAIEVQRDGSLVLTPLQKKPSLAELLAKTPKPTPMAEVDWGTAQGNEAW